MDDRCFLDMDRIPVFIGKAGSKKREIEKKFSAKIDVNSDTGEVLIESDDSVNNYVITNIVAAVNLGHNPDRALCLEDEHCVLDVIDIKTMIHDTKRLNIVLGRIIGKQGSTRKLIEEITKCSVSVKDHYVSVVGAYENTLLVHEALDMLIKGASHKSFYSYLERNKVNFGSGLL